MGSFTKWTLVTVLGAANSVQVTSKLYTAQQRPLTSVLPAQSWPSEPLIKAAGRARRDQQALLRQGPSWDFSFTYQVQSLGLVLPLPFGTFRVKYKPKVLASVPKP